jgi:hypothetical protein
MRIEVVTTSRRLTISGRRWTTERTQAHLQIAWNLPDDLDWRIPLPKPHNCGFMIDLIRCNSAVNRDNHVVSSLVRNVPLFTSSPFDFAITGMIFLAVFSFRLVASSVEVLENGVPGTAMPPWHSQFSADQRHAVVEFVRSLYGTPQGKSGQ